MRVTSFFSMDLVHEVSNMKDVEAAKLKAAQAVKESSARNSNKHKALAALGRCSTIENIMITLTNFILAHPSENLAVIQ